MAKPVRGKKSTKAQRSALAAKNAPVRRRQFDQALKAYISEHTTLHDMKNAAVSVSKDGGRVMTAMLICALTRLVAVATTGLPARKTLQVQDLQEAYTAISGIWPVELPAATKPAKTAKPIAKADEPGAETADEPEA
jgi:hypothetical protein